MRVLLIQAYLGRREPYGNVFPIGLCYIATPLAMHGHDVRVIDQNFLEDPYGDLEVEAKKADPEVVGVSLRNIDTTMKRDIFYYYKTLKPTIQTLRRVLPRAKIMLGGAGYSMFAERIMEDIPEIDFGVYLEGDETTPELLKNLDNPENVKGIFYREGGKLHFTGIRPFPDVSSIPIPRRDFLDSSKYFDPMAENIGIQTKRGCPLRCAYCSYPFLNGAKPRLRTAESVVDEIEYLLKDCKTSKFMFLDSTFNVPPGHAESICREIIRRNLQKKIVWSAWFETRGFSEELMNLAKEAGCYKMSFSPDAASDETLDALCKDLTEADIYRAARIARRSKGLVFGFSFFCTPPDQGFIGVLKTIKMYFAIHLMLLGRGGASLSWIRIEPETRMLEIAVKDGILKKDTDLLPETAEELGQLFYSCPNTKWYADGFFRVFMGTVDAGKLLAKKVLKRIRARGAKRFPAG